jgi:hypothetical protein
MHLLFKYLRAVTHHWLPLVGGGVLLTTIGVYERYARGNIPWPIYVAILVIFGGWASFLTWKAERESVLKMESRLTTTLKCSFHMQDERCVRRNRHIAPQNLGMSRAKQYGTYFRLVVTAMGDKSIHKCTGYITGIERAGQNLLAGEILKITFSDGNASDATERDVRPGKPEMLDFLFIGDDNVPTITTRNFTYPSSIPMNLLKSVGEYRIELLINGENTNSSGESSVSVRHGILLEWNGTEKQSTLRSSY